MAIDTLTVTALWTGLTRAQLKSRTLWKLKQKPDNYNRYSEASIEDALNDAQIEAAKMTKCLRGFGILTMKDGYAQYKPPTEMLQLDKAFFYQSATSYYELIQKSRAWLDRFKKGWRVQEGDPQYVFSGDSYGTMRKIGFYPRPDTDGDNYAVSPDTGVYGSATGMSTSGNVTGTNSVAHATVCTDTDGISMSDSGVTVGMMAVNVTDDSSGQISAVSGSTFTVTLTGGTANTWALGDSYTVLAGEYGVVTDWSNDEKFLFTSDIGGIIAVETLTNNVMIEYCRRPLPLQFDTQYPEIPSDLHPYLPDGAVWSLKRNSPRASSDLEEATIAYQAFQAGIMKYVDLDGVLEDDVVMNCWNM